MLTMWLTWIQVGPTKALQICNLWPVCVWKQFSYKLLASASFMWGSARINPTSQYIPTLWIGMHPNLIPIRVIFTTGFIWLEFFWALKSIVCSLLDWIILIFHRYMFLGLKIGSYHHLILGWSLIHIDTCPSSSMCLCSVLFLDGLRRTLWTNFHVVQILVTRGREGGSS